MPTEGEHNKILLVDDDPNVLSTFSMLLSRKGFVVVAMPNAQEALETLQTQSVDIIVSDINMPEIDGFTLREILLGRPDAKDIPFIFLTGRGMVHDQIRGLDQGAEEYLVKPIEPDLLIAKIKAVLARRRSYLDVSRNDSLTGLLNRYWTEQTINSSIKNAGKSGLSASLVFLDLDNFKRINDDFGHAEGDATLIQFAQILRENMRTVDILGRYGGDEFISFLPNTNNALAFEQTERILDILQEKALGKKKTIFSFSAGIAEFPKDGIEFSVLCSKADQAMYQAKRAGKNRICLWDHLDSQRS